MFHLTLVDCLPPVRYPQLLADKEPVLTHAILVLRHIMEHNSAFGVILHVRLLPPPTAAACVPPSDTPCG